MTHHNGTEEPGGADELAAAQDALDRRVRDGDDRRKVGEAEPKGVERN